MNIIAMKNAERAASQLADILRRQETVIVHARKQLERIFSGSTHSLACIQTLCSPECPKRIAADALTIIKATLKPKDAVLWHRR